MFTTHTTSRKGVISMCSKTTCLLTGLALGIMIGYQKENEIDDFTRQLKRSKKKMLRKMDDMKNQLDM